MKEALSLDQDQDQDQGQDLIQPGRQGRGGSGRESSRCHDVTWLTLSRLMTAACSDTSPIHHPILLGRHAQGYGHRGSEALSLSPLIMSRCRYLPGLLTYCLTTRIGLASTSLGIEEGGVHSAHWETDVVVVADILFLTISCYLL